MVGSTFGVICHVHYFHTQNHLVNRIVSSPMIIRNMIPYFLSHDLRFSMHQAKSRTHTCGLIIPCDFGDEKKKKSTIY